MGDRELDHTHHRLMLSADELAEVEGDALVAIRAANDGDAPGALAIALALTGREPLESSKIRGESKIEGDQIYFCSDLSPARRRFAIVHECGHKIYRAHPRGPRLEARCDAFAAAVTCPRDPFRRLLRRLGHRVHELADRFNVTQSVSLLRIGEVSGRPVLLLREAGPIARGAAFGWPSTSAVVRALEAGRSTVHPVRIVDEPNRVGLMASRAAWAAIGA